MSACENPNVDKDVLMIRRQKFDGKTKICVKCKENVGNVVIRYAVYCKPCFFPLIETRFRKSLEPSVNVVPDGPRRKGLKAAGSLVIAFSGGTGSTALLDLVAKTYFAPRADSETLKGGKEHPRNADKSVWKGRPAVCFVEVCGAFPGEKDRTEDIKAVVESYPGTPFEFVPLRLEDAFNPDWWSFIGRGDLPTSARSLGLDMTDEDLRLNESVSEQSPLSALRAYLSSLPTQTAFFNSIQTLIRVLLLHTSASRRASHLILGTSLTSLSVNLISGIAQGAGFTVAEEVKEEWNPRITGRLPVRVVRPLRDIGMKECAIWDWWRELRVVGRSRKYVQGGGKNAIGALTRDFIVGLESDYPATVSTVARTCAKLTPKDWSDVICVLCGRPAQHGVQEWKAHISIRAYEQASSAVSGNSRPPHLNEEEITKLVEVPQNTPSSLSLTPRLCYACHTTLTSRSSRGTAASLSTGQSIRDIPTPMWVRAAMDSLPTTHEIISDGEEEDEVSQNIKMTRTDMEAQIAEFLLPDE